MREGRSRCSEKTVCFERTTDRSPGTWQNELCRLPHGAGTRTKCFPKCLSYMSADSRLEGCVKRITIFDITEVSLIDIDMCWNCRADDNLINKQKCQIPAVEFFLDFNCQETVSFCIIHMLLCIVVEYSGSKLTEWY